MSNCATVFYFAYGSNLDREQFLERCPGTQMDQAFVAYLPDHELIFPRFSLKRQSGVAGLQWRPGKVVWGVVYTLTLADLMSLDICEGFEEGRPNQMNHYQRQRIHVFRSSNPHVSYEVFVYFANPEIPIVSSGTSAAPAATAVTTHFAPTQSYLQHLLVGAAYWKLPSSYIEFLQSIKVAPF